MMRNRFAGAAALALCLSLSTIGSAATDTQPMTQEQTKAELKAAWTAAEATATPGPATIDLAGQAKLRITPDEVFIPATEANRIMLAMGNGTTPSRVGLIVGRNKDARWLAEIKWIKEGYVRDGEAKDWKADALLANLKENAQEQNKDRVNRGLPAMDIDGWVQAPAYDKANHRLVWSLAAHEREAPGNEPQTINYNTFALGRDGYFSLDLVTGSDTIASDKAVANDLLASLNYGDGKRYEDFNPSTDKVATYGLGALIGVVAAKKLGLIGLFGIFLLKAWKLSVIALVGGWAAIKKFFGGRNADADT